MEQVQTASDFDNLLVKVVEETLQYSLGEGNTNIIQRYLNERNLPFTEIPNKPEQFSEELRNILGFGSRQILCAASILEETILETLCKKLDIPFNYKKPVNFPLLLKRIRGQYISGENRR